MSESPPDQPSDKPQPVYFRGGAKAWPPEMKERAFQLYKSKTPNVEIARLLGVPFGTIDKWSTKGKWRERVKLTAAELSKPLAPVVVPEVFQMPPTFEGRQTAYKEKASAQALRTIRIMEQTPDALVLSAADKFAKLDAMARKALHLEEPKAATIVNIGLLQTPAGQIPRDAPAVLEAEIVPESDSELTAPLALPS